MGSGSDVLFPGHRVKSYTCDFTRIAPALRTYHFGQNLIPAQFWRNHGSEYIRTIAHCLKPGTGVWINTGPLLWHQAAGAPYDCLQLSQEELLQVRDFVTVSL